MALEAAAIKRHADVMVRTVPPCLYDLQLPCEVAFYSNSRPHTSFNVTEHAAREGDPCEQLAQYLHCHLPAAGA
jgi:hypothetical protein